MIIVHRCGCGHRDLDHAASAPGAVVLARRNGPCLYRGCGCGACEGPPQVIPTWDARHRPVTAVHPPGTGWSSGLTACGCADCHELYERVTA